MLSCLRLPASIAAHCAAVDRAAEAHCTLTVRTSKTEALTRSRDDVHVCAIVRVKICGAGRVDLESWLCPCGYAAEREAFVESLREGPFHAFAAPAKSVFRRVDLRSIMTLVMPPNTSRHATVEQESGF